MSTFIELPLHAEAERRWNLDWIEGQSLLMVRPRLLHGIAIHASQYYDTALARVDGATIVPIGRKGWRVSAPSVTPTTLFCGLSVEEYHAVCASQQMPKAAVLVDDALRAVSTQWVNAPTFERPAIVARVTKPMPARAGGLTSVITEVWVGKPYRMSAGQITMERIDNRWAEGERQSPTSWLVWKRLAPGTPIETEPHAYRLGWCLTCDVPRYDCIGNERSGNRGHKGRPGERGGSAAGELHSAGDALHSLLNGEKVNIHREEVREFVERARDQHEDPDITDMHVEGMLIYGGNGLGIARKDMPQIPREHREGFLKELKNHGVEVRKESVSPLSLAPTQREISARLVGEKLKAYEDNPEKDFPPLLVAEDSHVLDGHHHWGAMATVAIDSPKAKVPIHRIMTTPKKALDIMHAYDKKHGIERKALAHTPTKDKRKKIAASGLLPGGKTYDLYGTASSGNYGHAGRPGERGGSASDGGSDSTAALTTQGTGEFIDQPDSTVPDLGTERPEPRTVDNVPDAVAAILNGEVIEIKDVRHVHTVLSKLAAMANDAKAKGENAPDYDLCKVSVQGSNLFCGSPLKTKDFPNGVPRIKMPQFSGKPVPGSRADALPRSEYGGVDATDLFVDYLKATKIHTSEVHPVSAATLKATQSELVGPTVAGMMTDKTYDPAREPIFISRDNYVLDGHHRWAAVVGRDAEDGRLGESSMNVIRVDAPMSELYFRAKKFAKEVGIKPKAAKQKLHGYADHVFSLLGRDAQYLLASWEESEHPRASDGKFDESAGGPSESKGAGSSSNKERTAKAGWTAAPKEAAPTSTASGGTSSGAASSGAGSTDGKPTGPTTTADATGEGPLKPPASLFKIADRMPPDERAALDVGYKSSQQAGFKGTIEDFFSEQVALYKHAPENDPRLKTWFYGDTLEAVEKDPEAKAHITKVVAKQQEEPKAGTTTPTKPTGPGEPGGPEREGLEGIVFKETGVDYGASPHVPIPEGDGEDEHKGGGGGGKKTEGDLKKEQALLAKLKPGTPEYLAQKKKVDALAATEKKGKKAVKGPGSTGAVTGPKGPGEAGAVGANADKVMSKMKADERRALDEGYAAAQKAGFDGTMDDYFVQQVALYQYAQEGDPRITTFFYGETLSRAQGDPALWQQVQSVIAEQQAAPAKLFWDRVVSLYGTATSGNHGHEGRPGERGGSAPGGGASKGESAAKPKDLSPDEKAALPHSDTLIVSKTAPSKDKPITLVFGGSFNPPHGGHVKAMEDAVRLMEEQGYKVDKVVIAPVGDVLLKKKLGDKMYPLKDRVEIAKRTFTDPRFEVSSGPGDETDNWPKDQKLKRTQLADWARKQNEGTTVVNVTGEDAVPGRENIEGFPSVFEGDKGTSHEGYHYLVVTRDEKGAGVAGASSSKIRAAIKEGGTIPNMTPEAEAYLRDMLAKNPQIQLSFDPDGESWFHLYGTASSGNRGHAGRPGQRGGSAPSDGGGESSGTAGAGSDYHFVEPPAEMVQHHADIIRNNPNASPYEKEHADIFGRAEAISALEMKNGDTEKRFSMLAEDGKTRIYTPERAEIHENAILDATAKAPKGLEKPTAIFLGGLTAAGKSTFEQSLKEHINKDDFVLVNPDAMKDRLPEYNGENAAVVHEESSYMKNALTDAAIENRQNVILDVTMGSEGKTTDGGVLGQIQRLKDAGYDVQVMFMDVDIDTSVYRSMSRYKEAVEKGEEGEKARYVPGDVIRKGADPEYGTKPRRVYEAVKDSGILDGPNDGYIMIDNRGPSGPTSFPPRTKEGRGGGKVVERKGNLLIPETGLKPAEHGD